LKYPQLYNELRKGRDLAWRQFWKQVFWGLLQGTVIALFAAYAFKESFSMIVITTFGSLVTFEILYMFSLSSRVTFKTFLMTCSAIV